MNKGTTDYQMIHHGNNIKRLREILGVKQDVLVAVLNITQQSISKLEKKALISDEILEKVANVLGIPVVAIKNYQDEIVVNIISNIFNDDSLLTIHQPKINQKIDKLIEMMEQLLKSEQEKNNLLEKILVEKQEV